jgi:hypothetical protein
MAEYSGLHPSDRMSDNHFASFCGNAVFRLSGRSGHRRAVRRTAFMSTRPKLINGANIVIAGLTRQSILFAKNDGCPGLARA